MLLFYILAPYLKIGMESSIRIRCVLKKLNIWSVIYFPNKKYYHRIPFLDLYTKTVGENFPESSLPALKKKHPNIDKLTHSHLQYTLKLLEKFGITAYEACHNPHVFSMNPITMDNYGEILKECGFVNIVAEHIIRYHTLVRNKTIKYLKSKGLLLNDLVLEEVLQNCFPDWPSDCKSLSKFQDYNTSILTVRMSVLQKYLHWRLSVSPEEFQKYCRHYLPLKHKPMSDIQEALDIAQNNIKFHVDCIRRNGFIISSDPVKTKMILENVKTLAGVDVREIIRAEPAILKNNDASLLQIQSILNEYQISEDAQRNCLRVFCMKPDSVRERLEELKNLKEFNLLCTNPRALSMVVHKNKVKARLTKIQDAKKQCFSLNNLVASSKVFNNYINSFGNKICGRDIAILISSSVDVENRGTKAHNAETTRTVLRRLKKHKYWLHAALDVVDENIKYLKTKFDNKLILNHCQLLLYPISEIEYYLNYLLKRRNGKIMEHGNINLDPSYNNLNYDQLTDDQILSLVLYEIEKKYHFSGDGIWAKNDGLRMDLKSS